MNCVKQERRVAFNLPLDGNRRSFGARRGKGDTALKEPFQGKGSIFLAVCQDPKNINFILDKNQCKRYASFQGEVLMKSTAKNMNLEVREGKFGKKPVVGFWNVDTDKCMFGMGLTKCRTVLLFIEEIKAFTKKYENGY